MAKTIEFHIVDGLELPQLMDDVKSTSMDACKDIVNDMLYVTRGAAPFDTSNLEKSISADVVMSSDHFEGSISISAYNNGFDYGALRHDYPFQLGAGSLNKPPVVSPITGISFVVGYSFASIPADANSAKYIQFIADKIQALSERW